MKIPFRWNWLALYALIYAAPSHSLAQDPSLTKPELALLTQCDTLEHRFDRRALLFQDAMLDQHLAAVAGPLLPAMPPAYIHWRFLVLRDPLVNSFSLPDGTIYVSTGLLSLLENDDQLAGVLAHEIAHVMKGDAFAFQREYRKKETARSVGTLAAIASTSVLAGGTAMMILAPNLLAEAIVAEGGRPIQLWIASGYGDEAEHIADQTALGLLSRAGRDPAQLARSLNLMSDSLDAQPISTFDADLAKLHQRLAGLPQPGASGAGDSKGYFAAAQGAIRENILMDIDSRRFRTAVASALRIEAASPEDARALYQLGEAYHSLGPRTAELTAEERSPAGRRDAVKDFTSRTVEEEDKLLAATPAGRTARDSNWKKAEELFQEAARRDPQLAEPHRGLGALYAGQSRIDDARAQYREYLEMAPAAPDRLRIENRLAALDHGVTIH